MAHYLFNLVGGEPVDGFLQAGMWGVAADEPHRSALDAGDLVLLYLGAPERELIGRAVLLSAVHKWTPSEAATYPGDASSGVLLADVEEWRPPLPMSEVLARIDTSEGARADFETGVVRITENEYETALSVRPTHPRRF
jgi:hypothetical protein